MIVIASRPPLTLQRIYKMHATPRRVNSRPRRKRVVVAKPVEAAIDPGLFVSGARLTAEMFTTAVFIYSTLNYFMYRRIRKENEKKK